MNRLLELRRAGGPLARVGHTYYPVIRLHEYVTPGGARLEYQRDSRIVEITTSTGERIALDPGTGFPFGLVDVLRVLGALQVITPLVGGVRIVA